MKKRFILTAGLVLLLVGASVGTASEKGFFAFEKPMSIEEQKRKEIVDNANRQFLEEVNQDIQKSLNLDVKDYEQIELSVLYTFEEYKGLGRLVMEVMDELEIGDVQPTLYKNEDKVLIMYKKADGSNVVHKYELDNETQEWEKTQKDDVKGRSVVHPLDRVNIPSVESKE